VAQRESTVLCVDDQAIFRAAVHDVIAATPGLTHVGDAASGRAAIVAVEALRPDLVLMDIHMPGLDGFQTARIIAERRRDVVVILMSADEVGPPPSFVARGGTIGVVDKGELCPRTLLGLWRGSPRTR
jgi:two-component system chemotaxis response regulator CheB